MDYVEQYAEYLKRHEAFYNGDPLTFEGFQAALDEYEREIPQLEAEIDVIPVQSIMLFGTPQHLIDAIHRLERMIAL